jgi:hypothetical protein
MKLAVIFDVPDDQADTYADLEAVCRYWSFDLEMRPVAAILAPTADRRLSDAVRDARRETQAFAADERLKPVLLAFLDALI